MNSKNKDMSKYVLVSIVSLFVGSMFMYILCGSKTTKNIDKDKFDIVYQTYNTLKNEYYKDVKDDVLIEGAVNGMMESLNDEHSVYFNEEEKKAFETELSGTYYGIGAEITSVDNKVKIKKVFDNSPAAKAGLKAEDIFISIDKESVEGKTVQEIASYLRSEEASSSVIEVEREGKKLIFNVIKENITLYSVSSEMLDDNIGFIAVNIFGQNTYSEFSEALKNLENKNMKSLIIDLRGNSGGYLSTVTDMLSIFLDKDKIIYQMQTKDGVTKYNSMKSGSKDYKIVILVDGDSASASEIMASAMKEQYNATLVGTKTYGKGTVQVTKDLSNGGIIKYTIQNWLTSTGKSIEKNGINPDYEIELSEEYVNNPSVKTDNQLQKAIELLK